MEKEENILSTEKIGKLILKFAIPSIISMLVNSLYNIVDQVFIGRGVGYLGNGATNVVFPLVILSLAFSLMIGDGTSAYLSLKLGEKKEKEAAKGVANGILISIIFSLLFSICSFIFLPQLLNLFGCTDALREYALNYGYIIVIGLPFAICGITLNGVIRADGSPKYSMTSMVSGAILNIILDPIFIFVFKMGVQGAAIATILSQILTFILNILYVRKFKTIKLSKDIFELDFGVVLKLLSLGISSFITEMSFVVVMSVQNNLFGKYGALSEYGSEVPITVFGIVMKISQILNSIIIGLSVGSQPIIGYNYGAQAFNRVKKTLKMVLITSVSVSTFAFILFQTIPDKLIMIFGSGEGGDALPSNYIEFACIAFRTYLVLCICNGVQIPAGIFFQAIGKSTKSAVLSLSRQILFLVPAFFILGAMFGLRGLLYAGPFADGLAFLISSALLIIEIKNLNKKYKKSQALIDDTSTDNKLEEKFVITVSREYGSGGRYVGRLIADKLGIKLYDKDLIIKLAERTGLAEEYIENNEQKRSALDILNNGYYAGLNNDDELFVQESELIREIASKESCVIIGRCADFILKDNKNVLKVFITGTMENKIKRATEIYGFDKDKAEKEINRINKLRANHYKHYTGNNWTDSSNYDLCINSDLYGVEKTADIICNLVLQKTNKKPIKL